MDPAFSDSDDPRSCGRRVAVPRPAFPVRQIKHPRHVPDDPDARERAEAPRRYGQGVVARVARDPPVHDHKGVADLLRHERTRQPLRRRPIDGQKGQDMSGGSDPRDMHEERGVAAVGAASRHRGPRPPIKDKRPDSPLPSPCPSPATQPRGVAAGHATRCLRAWAAGALRPAVRRIDVRVAAHRDRAPIRAVPIGPKGVRHQIAPAELFESHTLQHRAVEEHVVVAPGGVDEAEAARGDRRDRAVSPLPTS